jgi:transposase
LSAGRRSAGRRLKKARREGRTIVWVDETTVYLLPSVVRTYAPRGRTPVLRGQLTRDHFSVIGAITGDGKIYTQMQRQAFDGVGIVRFLQHLLRQIPGQLLVIWDGLPAHCGEAVKGFLTSGAAARLQLEQLPSYAPELNPVEGLWHYLKHVELRNVCFPGFGWLADGITRALKRLRHTTSILAGFLRQVDYTVPVATP